MILFVGDRPSKQTDPNVPFKGAACEKRLNEWINKLITRNFVIVNQSNTIETASWVAIAIDNNYPIVALGSNASKALTGIPHFKLPHPSGRNRQINDKAFINAKLEACKEYLKNY